MPSFVKISVFLGTVIISAIVSTLVSTRVVCADIPANTQTMQNIEKTAPPPLITPESISLAQEDFYMLGIGGSIPDFIHVDGIYRINNLFAVRGFYSLPIKASTIDKEPRKQEAIGAILKLATPEMDIHVTGHYIRNFGVDVMYFPFASSFFVSAGLAYRKIYLEAHGSVPIYACLTQGTIPCTEANQAIATNSTLIVDAYVESISYVMRGTVGWLLSLTEKSYLLINAFGIAKPTTPKRNIDARARLNSDNGLVNSSTFSEIVGDFLDKKDSTIRNKVTNKTKVVDETVFPIIGVTYGYRF